MKTGNRCASCGLLKSHGDHVYEHEFVPEAKEGGFGSKRSPINRESDRPGRVQRAQEVADARQQRREAVRHCEAPEAGIETPCGTGVEATLEASHVYGLGMGGGKEYNEIRMLCRKHHGELDTDRQTFREAGLSKHAPRPEKVVPRPVESITFDRPRPVRGRRSVF